MPRIVRSRTLLPDPDSPRMARIRPSANVKDTSFTARTSASRVGKRTDTFRISSAGEDSMPAPVVTNGRSRTVVTQQAPARAKRRTVVRNAHRDAVVGTVAPDGRTVA